MLTCIFNIRYADETDSAETAEFAKVNAGADSVLTFYNIIDHNIIDHNIIDHNITKHDTT